MGALLRRRKEGAGTGWRSTGMTSPCSLCLLFLFIKLISPSKQIPATTVSCSPFVVLLPSCRPTVLISFPLFQLADHPPPYPLPPPASIPAPHPQDTSPSSLPSEPAPTFIKGDSSQGKKKLVVAVTAVNVTAHLEGVVRQQGGIGSAAHDEQQATVSQVEIRGCALISQMLTG